MEARDLERAFALLDQHRHDLRLTGPPPLHSIEAAEELLGARFPPSYRAFVEREGAGSIMGREVYGVLSDVNAIGPPSLVWRTLQARESSHLPDRYLVIVDFDDSSALALDASRRRHDGEYPVVRVWPGEDEGDLVHGDVADDFGSFLLRFVEERLGAG